MEKSSRPILSRRLVAGDIIHRNHGGRVFQGANISKSARRGVFWKGKPLRTLHTPRRAAEQRMKAGRKDEGGRMKGEIHNV